MSFFDKKEEVMKIELTPYGRYLLSIGKLNPHHYKFFDDDITYDIAAYPTSSAGTYASERQNDAHVRIINETPRLKRNPNVSGVQTNINISEEVEDPARVTTTPDLPVTRDNQRDDNVNQLQQEIGTNSYTTDKNASFNVSVYNADIKKCERFLVSSNTQNLNISQIDIDFNYEYRMKQETAPNVLPTEAQIEELTNQTDMTEIYRSPIFQDKTYFEITPKVPLVYAREHNSFDEKENFDVIAYSVDVYIENVNGVEIEKEIYTPFRIKESTKKIINDILLDNAVDEPIFDVDENLDERNLEFFLNIRYDKEVPDIDICKALGNLEVNNIFLDEYIDCEDLLKDDEAFNPADIYSSRVRPSDLEDCDDDT